MSDNSNTLLTIIVIELAILLGGLYYAAQQAQAEVSNTSSTIGSIGTALTKLV